MYGEPIRYLSFGRTSDSKIVAMIGEATNFLGLTIVTDANNRRP